MKGDFNGIGGYLQTDQLKRIEASGNAKVLDAKVNARDDDAV